MTFVSSLIAMHPNRMVETFLLEPAAFLLPTMTSRFFDTFVCPFPPFINADIYSWPLGENKKVHMLTKLQIEKEEFLIYAPLV